MIGIGHRQQRSPWHRPHFRLADGHQQLGRRGGHRDGGRAVRRLAAMRQHRVRLGLAARRNSGGLQSLGRLRQVRPRPGGGARFVPMASGLQEIAARVVRQHQRARVDDPAPACGIRHLGQYRSAVDQHQHGRHRAVDDARRRVVHRDGFRGRVVLGQRIAQLQCIKPRDHALGRQARFKLAAQLGGGFRRGGHLHALDPDVRQMHQARRLVDLGTGGKVCHAVGGIALGGADRHRHAACDAVGSPGIYLGLIELHARAVGGLETARPLQRTRGLFLRIGLGGRRLRRGLSLGLRLRRAGWRQARAGSHAGHGKGESEARKAPGRVRGR
ncbi:hypothetical protein ACAE110713_08695 [Achromobacter aegrifaciens]